ncbi:hypothetical protein BDQ12DRAFT_692757 [Crucibulum laeve]|uniref:Uncharacterized protein n=1 Tax=Crucibulum laeve TaxID=68775 RepID=A0A5C3LGM2_9AGAR|nr:hypothetical protein BDQ12DRAFT_692757 [Crucibulum laeve]
MVIGNAIMRHSYSGYTNDRSAAIIGAVGGAICTFITGGTVFYPWLFSTRQKSILEGLTSSKPL